ncbi:hypothetical protein T3H00_29480 [Pseudomonas fluorescens]|uniref:hypothetical protein n=1 Tax=Pseudomonas fluorescens TaxID=294 RepID=UPI002ACABCB5|nr:hypothetical protein [Pseudomonas fluorescens]MDZ5436773.1 hypothetical protein [Pseudomonas fluorescens]
MREKKNKSKAVVDSILARISLLESILQSPKTYISDENIIRALSSQGSLASLTHTFMSNEETFTILPLSVTTLKAKISTVSDGLTWESFDALRLQARDCILQAARTSDSLPKQTKLGLKESLANAEAELENQREINFRLIQAISKTVGSIRDSLSITKAELRAKHAEETIQTIYKVLGLNDFPFNKADRSAVILALTPDRTS